MARLTVLHFNSTLVRLKDQMFIHLQPIMADFNSTLVRLKGQTQHQQHYMLMHFNSTLVRLKELRPY